MTKQILKVIAAGVLGGIAIFLMPFILLRILAIVLIIRLIFRLVGGPRRHWKHRGWNNHFYPSFARRWEHMNNDERKAFQEKIQADFFSKIN